MIRRKEDLLNSLANNWIEFIWYDYKLPEFYISAKTKHFSISLDFPPSKYYLNSTCVLSSFLYLEHDKFNKIYGINIKVTLLNLTLTIEIGNGIDFPFLK